jgi:hypothetical protein
VWCRYGPRKKKGGLDCQGKELFFVFGPLLYGNFMLYFMNIGAYFMLYFMNIGAYIYIYIYMYMFIWEMLCIFLIFSQL